MATAIRVLYVDDEPGLLDIGKLFLEREGAFAVDTLTSAMEALKQLDTERYDAVISDYQMPEMDGIAFLKHLRASGNTTPFIIFTGRGREEVVIEALNSGADFYLQKGGEPKAQFAELAHKILSAVSRQKTEKLAKDTQRRLYDIINFLPDATFAIDTGGKVIAWNRAIEEMTGVPASDMLGRGNYEYSVPFYGKRRPILIDLVNIPNEELSEGKYAIVKKEGDILIAETTLPRPLGRDSVLLGKASLLYNDEGESIGAIESIRDVTEQKRAEEALRESGRQLNAMATNIPGVVYRYYVNPDGTDGFAYISGRSRQILGLENDPATFFDRITTGIVPKDRERFISSVQQAIRTKKLWVFDGQYTRPSGKTIWVSALSSPLMENDRLIFDGVIFDNTERKLAEEELLRKNDELSASYEQIAAAEEELHANVDELTRQEQALRESGESFQSLVETAPDAIYISLGERFAYVNPAMVRLMGATSADQLLGMSLYDRIHPSFHEGIRERARIVINERKPAGLMETVYLKMDGTPVDIESAVATFRYHDNFAGLVILRDITLRKQAEQRLRESEYLLTETQKIARLGGWKANPHTDFLEWTEGVYDIIEAPRDYRPGLNEGMKYYAPEDIPVIRKKVVTCLATGEPFALEVEIITETGKKVWTELRGLAPVIEGTRSYVMGTLQDISDRKDTLDTLRESEAKYRTVIEQSNDGIIIARDGLLVFHNPSFTSMTGYCDAELEGRSIADLIAPEDRELVMTRHRQRSSGKILPEAYEFSVLHHDNMRRIRVIMHVSSATIGGRPATIGTLHNVTGERQREEALRASEEKYRSVIDNIQDMFYRSDREGNLIMASPSCLRKLGYGSFDEIFNKPISETFYYSPEKRKELIRIIEEKGSIEDSEVQLKKKDGTPLWVSTSSHYYRDESGAIAGIEGIFRDITERKEAQIALQHQSATLTILNTIITTANKAEDLPQLFSTILDASLHLLDFDAGGIYLVDRSTRTAHIVHSKNLTKGFLEEIQSLSMDKKPYDTLFVHNKPIIAENYALLAPERSKKYGFQSMASIPLLSKGVAVGALNIASTRRYVISEGEKQTLISICRELGSTVERMLAEEEVKKASINFETLFNSINEMVFVLDMQGCILAVNDAVRKRLSYTSEELSGMNLLQLHDPGQRDEALRMVQGMIEGTIDSSPVSVLAKDGSRVEVETKVTRGWWNNQEVLIGVSRDITERRQAGEALRQANRKLTLLTGITRHDINNQLTLLRGYLSILEELQPNPPHPEYFRNIATAAQRISSMIEFTREYEEIGVNAPVWHTCRTLVDTAAREIPLGKIKVKNDLPAGAEVFADPLIVRVCYNLMDNAVRYGGKITTLRFSVQERDGAYAIVCEDDGDGVPAEEKERIFDRGFGKNTGLGLALSREILLITGITIRETGEPGKGARFEMTVPKGIWRIAGKMD